MKINNFLFGLGLTLVFFFRNNLFLSAQNIPEKWSKVKVTLSDSKGMKQLAVLGVETDHGQLKPGRWFISDFSTAELKSIRNAGFTTEVLVENVQADFIRRNQGAKSVQTEYYDPACNRSGRYRIPANWDYGSMGGHLTYREMLAHLDSMYRKYPALISPRTPLDTLKTEGDSLIWRVRISDNPLQNETGEPKALFTAVHHAREPVGMHQLIFFMWYLLENYSSNPEIQALVNQSDLYFVPCLNPDGYRYNEEQFPDGGGMWRKNRRPNGDGTFGTDLNRNYGHQWGIDDFGSSPDAFSDVYRGPAPFSEAETQAVRNFCNQHNIRIALNYHTFGNLLLHPWGYDGSAVCPDLSLFRSLASELTRENSFRTGSCMEALNYNSNGSSDDYMYAASPQKASILAMTPEVGNEFWPTQSEILPLCLKTLHQNLATIRALHPMLSLKAESGTFLRKGFAPASGPPALHYSLTRTGSNSAATNFTVTFKAFGGGTEMLPAQVKNYSGLVQGQTVSDSILLPQDHPAVQQAGVVFWEARISNQLFETTDTLHFFGGTPTSGAELSEACEDPSAWTGSWIFSSQDASEGSACLKTSEGNYLPNQRSYMQRIRPFDLRSPDIRSAEMRFQTRFGIEKNYDFASLQFSTDSGANWIPVCTNKTLPSSPFSNQAGIDEFGQDTIMPVWDGAQPQWQSEYIDLQDYLGNKLWIRFYFRSDDFTEDWGFAVDDIRIRVGSTLTTDEKKLSEKGKTIRIAPNPGNGHSDLSLKGFRPGMVFPLILKDAAGRIIFSKEVQEGRNAISAAGLKPGCYLVEIQDLDGAFFRLRWMVN